MIYEIFQRLGLGIIFSYVELQIIVYIVYGIAMIIVYGISIYQISG